MSSPATLRELGDFYVNTTSPYVTVPPIVQNPQLYPTVMCPLVKTKAIFNIYLGMQYLPYQVYRSKQKQNTFGF